MMPKIAQGVGDVKYQLLMPALGKYAEFVVALGALYLFSYGAFGEVGFGRWLLHPSIPLVAIFAARHGFMTGLASGSLAMTIFALVELSPRPINVTQLEHLSPFLFLAAIVGLTAMVFGIIRDRSIRRVKKLEKELSASRIENAQLREFIDETKAELKRYDISQAFGATKKTLRIFEALDAVYLSDRKSLVNDISKLLDLIVPGISVAFLNSDRRVILASRTMARQRQKMNGDKHKHPSFVEAKAPVSLPDILPEARWLVLSTQCGLTANDLETCLKVVHRCLIRDELMFDFGGIELERRAN